MALPPRRVSALLLIALTLAAIVFSSFDAARAPAALEAAAADWAQAPATGSDDAMPVEHVVVVDKRGGGHGGGHGGGGHGGGGGGGLGGAGYHGHGSGRGHKSASSSRAGVWKVGAAASVLGAAAWLL